MMLPMFIRKTKKKDPKTKKAYYTYQLVESVRTERGPRQRILLSLGSELKLKEQNRKLLANRIEEIISGQGNMFPYPGDVETLAQEYAARLIRRLSNQKGEPKQEETLPDYATIDLNTVQQQEPRTVGAEHLLLQITAKLKLSEKLKECGFSKSEIALALGNILGRAIAPGSERSTHTWLKERSGLGELIGYDFQQTSLDQFYKISDKLLKNKNVLENHLANQSQEIHGYKSTMVLFDLTNTYMEGRAESNEKAQFGHSKEKRSDCPLVTLGLVVNEYGFAMRSEILPGNISEPSTLQTIIESLRPDDFFKPTIILDAGIASNENLEWLCRQGYKYIVSARQKPPSLELEDELTPVNSSTSQVKAALIATDAKEKWLYCESEGKRATSTKMKRLFQERFETALRKMAEGISKPRGHKKYEKILERIGRLKEKHKRISGCYEITVTPSADQKIAISVEWKLLPEKLEESLNAHYFLRTNHLDKTAVELWDLYANLRIIEDSFRFMKSDLGMRPVYHQKTKRVDGHLWITLLAYHLIRDCLYRLGKQGISSHWKTILNTVNSRIRVTMQARLEGKKVLYHRSTTKPERSQQAIYQALGISSRILRAKKVVA